jgi:hypothetical protein
LSSQLGIAAIGSPNTVPTVSGISVKNMTINGVYVHTGFTDPNPGADQSWCIHIPQSSGSNFVGGCYFQDVGTAVQNYGNTTWVICSNHFERYNHGCYPSALAGATYIYVSSNYFGSMTNWCTTADTFHNDGIIWGIDGQTGQPSVFAVTNNIFAGPIAGPTDNATAYIFAFNNPALYEPIVNNLFIDQPGDPLIGNGNILAYGVDAIIDNNTIIGNGNSLGIDISGETGSGVTMRNNIIYNCPAFVSIGSAVAGNGIQNNLYAGSGTFSINGTENLSYSQWVSQTGETGSLNTGTTGIISTTTGQLLSGSPAIAAGTGAAYTTDKVINDLISYPRNASAMDIGALAFESGTPTASQIVVTLPGQTFNSGVGNSGTPSTQTAGEAFNIVHLTATDSANNTATGYSGTKTITFTGPSTSPGGNAPSYTTSVSFTSGQSTTTLATTLYNAQSTTISATDGALTGIPSSSLFVNPAVASALAFSAQPGGGIGGKAWPQQPIIPVLDAYQNIVTGFNQTVLLSIYNNPSGGTLSGTNPLNVNTNTGLATFTNLSIDLAGVGYTLTVIGSSVETTPGTVVSSPFTITHHQILLHGGGIPHLTGGGHAVGHP